jgi:hypothetical protein
MTIYNINNWNISQYIPFGLAYFYKFISYIYMAYKGEIDIGIRLHSRTWTSFFFRNVSVVLFLNMMLL